MNRRQENKLSMYLTVEGYLAETEATWSPVNAFATQREKFATLLSQIQELAGEQDTTSVGTTAEKTQRQRHLAREVADAAAALEAYALVNNDEERMADADLTHSDIIRAADTQVQTLAEGLRDLIAERATELADYNYSEQDLADLNRAIDAWKPYVQAPRKKIAQRKTATAELLTAFEATDDTLEILDRLAQTFRKKNPSFHLGYENARIIVDNRGASSAKPEAE